MLTSPHQHDVLSPPLLLFPLSCFCAFPSLTTSLPCGGAAMSSQRSQRSALLRPCWMERKTTGPQLIPSILCVCVCVLQHSSLLTSIISLTTLRSPSVAFPLHVIEDCTLSHHGIPSTPMVLLTWPQDILPPPPGMPLGHLTLKVCQLHSSSPSLCRDPETGSWEFL